MALGSNNVAAVAGSFLGLVIGGVLAEWDWRAVFWVSVPLAILGTVWGVRSLRELGTRRTSGMDWWRNLTFTVGLTALLVGITYGIRPYGGSPTGWGSPRVLILLATSIVSLIAFVAIERRGAEPMFQLALFRIRAFAAGNVAGFLASVARGGLQFMLVIWLQGIWLPLHGYSFAETPLWAGIYLLPMTAAFLISGPAAGCCSC
jgi:MFS family permease